jgi:hypothetical protein
MNPKWHTADPNKRLTALLKIRMIALAGAAVLVGFGLLLLFGSFQVTGIALGMPVHTYLLTGSLFLLALGTGVFYVAIVTAREIAQGRAYLANRNATSRQ